MISSNFFLSEILNQIDRASILSELHPKDKGKYIYLTCPSCGQETAYIANNGYYIHCNRKNNCGYSNGIIDYIAHRDSITDDEAIRYLAQLTGVRIPEMTEAESEQFRLNRAKQTLYKDILQISKFGLWKFGANAVDYLRLRGYSDFEIINMDFGCLPIISELEAHLIAKKHPPELVSEVISSFRTSHKLLLPILNPSGIISGFISRTIEQGISPKYLYSKGISRGSYLMNSHTAYNHNTVLIIEGIIDALLLTERGNIPALACGSNYPTAEQLNYLLKNKQLKNIILCLDNDPAGRDGTAKAIELLQNQRVKVFVASTAPHKDPDEFIKANGIDEFILKINRAEKSTKWLINRILDNNPIDTDLGRENILSELLELHNSIIDPIEAEYILNVTTDILNIPISSIEKRIELFNEIKAKENLKDAYKNTLNQANKYLYNNNLDDLSSYLNDSLSQIKSLNTVKLIKPYFSAQAISDIKNRQDSLCTGYADLDKHIGIHNGALTLVAGRPSHGKTSFLLNLFMNMINKYNNKSFFFFSYEESKTALYVKLINLLSDAIINSQNPNSNTQQIEYYIKGNLTSMPKINNSMKIFDDYVNNNRLWLIDDPMDVETLTSTITNLNDKYDIGAIFIDYAQRVKYSGKYESERVKIARISESLRENATKLDLPFIVGTQLNRENAKSKPQLENLKEAGNLEEDANLALGIYNWKTALNKEQIEYNSAPMMNCKNKPVQTNDRKIDFEVHILKNRNGAINDSALLSFDAPLLKISDNNNYTGTQESVF